MSAQEQQGPSSEILGKPPQKMTFQQYRRGMGRELDISSMVDWNFIQMGFPPTVLVHMVDVFPDGRIEHGIDIDMPGGVVVFLYRDNPHTRRREVATILEKRAGTAVYNEMIPQALESFPRETIDSDEYPRDAVIRGVQAETGIQLLDEDLQVVEDFNEFPIFFLSDARGYGFMAKVPYQDEENYNSHPDDTESIGRVRWRPIADFHGVAPFMKDPFSRALWNQIPAGIKDALYGTPRQFSINHSNPVNRPQDLPAIGIEQYLDQDPEVLSVLGDSIESPFVFSERKIPTSHWGIRRAGPFEISHSVEKHGVTREVIKDTVHITMPPLVYGVFYRVNSKGIKEVLVERDGEHFRFPRKLQHESDPRSIDTLRALAALHKTYVKGDLKLLETYPLFPKLTTARAQGFVLKAEYIDNADEIWVPYPSEYDVVREKIRDPHSLIFWGDAKRGLSQSRPF